MKMGGGNTTPFALKKAPRRRMLPTMRSAHFMPYSFLSAAMLLGFAFGCSDDSGDDPNTTGTMGTGTMTTAATSTVTTGTATGTGTTGTATTGTATTGTANVTSTVTATNTATSTTGGSDGSVPADGSQAAITAFLEAEGYKGEGWVSVHDAPVPPTQGTPHGNVRVYMSPALVTFRQGNPDLLEEPAVPGAMAVKEMYDDASTLVGKAVTFYPANEVVYYCYGPDGRCASGRPATTIDAPEYGDEDGDSVDQCDVCHSGNVYTELP